MPHLPTYIRKLDPQLPRSVWILELGTFVNFLGSGIAFPYLLIYLHNVRGIDLGTSGLVVSTMGVVALAVGPLVGPILDRFGSHVTLGAALSFSGVGFALMPLAHHAPPAFVLAGVIGVGTGTFWPAVSVLLTGLVTERRHQAFAIQRVAVNLGLGVGGLVGGLIATSSHPTSFTILFLVDAATYVGMIAVLPKVPRPDLGDEDAAAGGYKLVLRDRPFLQVVALNVVYIAFGYAAFELLPVFAKNATGVNERWIGVIFFVNTITLVIAQLPVARFVEGRRRMRALAVMPVLYAVAWLIVLAGGAWLRGTGAALVFVAAAAVIGFASCFQGPTQGALIADLAPPRLRGRYMALSSMSWEVGFVIGPAAGGFILGSRPLALWAIAALACGLAAAATFTVERSLPPELARTPAT